MCKKLNISEGDKFNKLTALNYSYNTKNHGSYWLFKCDCGNEKIMRVSNVTSKFVKSCGCFTNGEKVKTLNSSFRKLFRDYYNGAKQRNLEFKLNEEQFKEFTTKDCFYCGREPYNIRYNQSKSEGYLYTGIDRIDSSKGYIENNIVPCCTICNKMKSNIKSEDFLNTVKLINKNLF